MRIVAGSARGRRIAAPPGLDTRPTTDRVREATFNALESLGAVRGATVIDLFAGSGALGLEALSRGAAHVTFVERDAKARAVIHQNLETLAMAERAEVVATDALAHLGRSGPADLLLCDPPYGFDRWADLLATTTVPIVVCESDQEVDPPPGWGLVRQKRYGATVVSILSRSSHEPPE